MFWSFFSRFKFESYVKGGSANFSALARFACRNWGKAARFVKSQPQNLERRGLTSSAPNRIAAADVFNRTKKTNQNLKKSSNDVRDLAVPLKKWRWDKKEALVRNAERISQFVAFEEGKGAKINA